MSNHDYRPRLSFPLDKVDQKAIAPVPPVFSTKSIQHDGVDEYISVDDSTRFDDINGDWTMAIWFRLDNEFNNLSASSMGLCGKHLDSNNHVSFALAGTDNSVASGAFYCKIENTTPFYLTTSQVTWLADIWYYALVTYDFSSGSGNLYINDVSAASGSVASMAPFTVAAPWEIGRVALEQASGAIKYFEGDLNNLSIHTEILTTSQRAEQYNIGKPIDLSIATPSIDLKFWWNLGATPDDLETSDGVIEAVTGLDDGTAVNMLNTDIINEAPGFP